MEQRNDCIDYHGQRRNPQIFHFAPAGLITRQAAAPQSRHQSTNGAHSVFAALDEHVEAPVGRVRHRSSGQGGRGNVASFCP